MQAPAPTDAAAGSAPAPAEAQDVFISYASEDRTRAAAVAQALERHGYSVWWDQQLGVNDAFSPAIEARIDAARAVVVLWSRHSAAKRFVREEAVRGQERLVPVRLDDGHVPLGFGQVSHVDLRRWRGDELSPLLDPLIAAVAERAGRSAQARPPPAWRVLRSLYLDLPTRILLAGLAFAGAALWLLRGPQTWRLDDLRWMALLLLVLGIGWAAGRAARFARTAAWRIGAAGTALSLAAAWSAGVWRHYTPPQFGGEELGLLVTRFQGDGWDNRVQTLWAVQLREQRDDLDTGPLQGPWVNRIRVEPLHRTVDDRRAAVDLASRLGALIVFWGMPDGSTGLSLAPRPGFFQLGHLALADVQSLSVDRVPVTALSAAVGRFAAGYGAYVHDDLAAARVLLQDLTRELSAAPGSAPAHTGLLATANLLLGNVAFLGGCQRGALEPCIVAMEHYTAALALVQPHTDQASYFVEASNNLAVAERMTTGSFETAALTLEGADSACRARKPAPPACRFVAFNRGVIANVRGQPQQALELLAPACGPQATTSGGGDVDSIFRASCHQQQAYAACVLGAQAQQDDEAQRWFAQAARDIDDAAAAIAASGDAAAGTREKITVTRARIAFGQRAYGRAAALLSDLAEPGPGAWPVLKPSVLEAHPDFDATEIATLLAVARACSATAPAAWPQLPATLAAADRDHLARRLAACQANTEGR